MICPDCKTENIAGADVCESCGADLSHIVLPSAEGEFTRHVTKDHVGDIEMKETRSVAPGDPVAYAVSMMQRYKTGCVLVHRDGQLVGILTDRDLLLKAAGDNVDLNALTVGELMTPDPVTVNETDSPAVAIYKMSVGGFRHLPVVADGRPMRVLSIRDLFRHVSTFIHKVTPVP